MDPLPYARQRVQAALSEIERLKQSEFPYHHSREALDRVEGILLRRQKQLSILEPSFDRSVINNECSLSLYQLFLYLPVLGFILRSTNVRNAFEAYWPLLRLARKLLGPSVRFMLSSEWDYSPFVYTRLPELEEFVLIGLPACESSNPLLAPLAGHELGHSLWTARELESKFQAQVTEKVVKTIKEKYWDEYSKLFPHPQEKLESDLFVRTTWQDAHKWTMLQMQEMYCDILGVRLFAEAFVHAFAYVLAPGAIGPRALNYPNLNRRVDHLCDAAQRFKVETPEGFKKTFEDFDEPAEPIKRLLVSIADDVSASFFTELLNDVEAVTTEKEMPVRTSEGVGEVCQAFEQIVPIVKAHTLTDVLNAGWRCYQREDLWQDIRHAKEAGKANKVGILQELILKSVEILEVEERLAVEDDPEE